MEKIFQVSEFNEFINLYLKQTGELVIEGEISEINVSQGKWLFITIKDAVSNLSVFAPIYSISGWQALQIGMKVHIYGVPGLFSKSGKFSFTATRIVPSGEGALRLAFEKLKLQLDKEGLFALDRKRAISRFPQKIGLITAKNSEAYNDFIKVSKERLGGLELFLLSVTVQGRDSVASIISAFDYFNKSNLDLDCIVLCRGGGSLEDLQSFNDEQVVRAVFASRVPVVVGVGHERDISLCDLVADVRASTPSNAAELLIPHRQALFDQIENSIKILSSQLITTLVQKNNHLNQLVNILDKSFLAPMHSLQQLQIRLNLSLDNWLKTKKQTLDSLLRLMQTFDHHTVLKRGYSLTTIAGKLVTSSKNVPVGSILSTEFIDGKIISKV